MIELSAPICIIDTNVLHPLWVRDILFWFAYYDLLRLAWTDDILKEWVEVMRRKRLSEDLIINRIKKVNKAFPEAKIEDYQPYLDCLDLPDKDDRHVVAAAIKTNAKFVITYNLKDFPSNKLSQYKIMAIDPDTFISNCITRNESTSILAFRSLVETKSNPKLPISEVIDILHNNGLIKTAKHLRTIIK